MKQIAMVTLRTVAAKSSFWCLAGIALTQLACSGEGNAARAGNTPPPAAANPSPLDNDPSGEISAEIGPSIVLDVSSPPSVMAARVSQDLAPLFPADAQLVGVAIDRAGARYVLEARTGLYSITSAGAELVFSLPESVAVRADGDAEPPSELTDVAYHPLQSSDGFARFALTAENDGFALTSGDSLLQSFFCYFPTSVGTSDIEPQNVSQTLSVSQELRAQGVAIKERTQAVAVHPLNGQVFAQPRTIRLDDGAVAGSELFVFAPEGGQPINTRRFEAPEFAAGGMAVLGESVLTLGYGSDLYVVEDWAASRVRRVATFEGVTIEGLAVAQNGDVLVLDGPGKRLLELDAQSILDIVAAPSRL